jgi:hypothetical protein
MHRVDDYCQHATRTGNPQSLEIQAAPRKPAAKTTMEETATMEETEELSTPTCSSTTLTEQQPEEVIDTVEKVPDDPSPASRSMKTLIQTASGMVKRAKYRPQTRQSSGGPAIIKTAVLKDFDEIITFMDAVYAIQDEMVNIKPELIDIKETVKHSEKAAKRNWATLAATASTSKAPTSADNHSNRRVTDDKSQQEQAQRRKDRVKVKVALTAEGAPRAAISQMSE